MGWGEFGVSAGMLEVVEDGEGREIGIVVINYGRTIDHLDVGREFSRIAIAFVAEGLAPFGDWVEPFEN